MKNYIFLALLLTGLVFTGCKKYVEGEDISPNSPSNVTEGLLLSGLEVATFSNFGGDLSRVTSVLTQQSTGNLFQYEDLAKYDITESTVSNIWNQLYSGSLINAQLLIDKAGDKNRHYRGIGRVLKALNLGLATDLWGDVPNKEALGGLNGNFNAAFDSQESVIADIQQTLDGAIADLQSTENVIAPGADDYIFGGDASKWLMNAYLLKARYANRLSKKDATGSANKALEALNGAYAAGYTGNGSNLYAIFGPGVTESNQWYVFNQDRAGYVSMGSTLVGMMSAINDPRLAFYAAKDGSGNYSNESSIGAKYGSAESKLPLLTYAEAKFIEAEAQMRLGNKAAAAAAHNAAVIANLNDVTGGGDAAFEAANANEDAASITMEKIMSQKYIAMFTQPEVYSDWRRTNIPALTPNAGANLTEIPRRFPTAQDERLYNTKAVVNSNLLDPVWWDK